MEPELGVVDNPELERYEIRVDGRLAGFTEYRGRSEVRALTHTEIDPEFERRGLGGELVRRTLDDVRRQGLRVIPICPFVTAFLAEHREYLDLVEPPIRRSFGLPEPSSG
jgi:uncharacterized protein